MSIKFSPVQEPYFVSHYAATLATKQDLKGSGLRILQRQDVWFPGGLNNGLKNHSFSIKVSKSNYNKEKMGMTGLH